MRTVVQSKAFDIEWAAIRRVTPRADEFLEGFIFDVSGAADSGRNLGHGLYAFAMANTSPQVTIFYRFNENEVELLAVRLVPLG